MAMQPRFSKDFSKLAYVGREQKFLSHTSAYELKVIKWPVETYPSASETLIERVKEYPSD